MCACVNHTGKVCLFKFQNWIWTVPSFKSNDFRSSVLLNILLGEGKKCPFRNCITATRARWSLLDTVTCAATKYLPMISWQHRDAVDKSPSQTWEVRPGSSVFSADALLDCRTCYRHLLRHDCHQSEEAHRHSC